MKLIAHTAEELHALQQKRERESASAAKQLSHDAKLLCHAMPSVTRWLRACACLADFLVHYASEDIDSETHETLSAVTYIVEESPHGEVLDDFTDGEVAQMVRAYDKVLATADGRFGFTRPPGIETENLLFGRETLGVSRFRERHIVEDVRRPTHEDRDAAYRKFACGCLNNEQIRELRELMPSTPPPKPAGTCAHTLERPDFSDLDSCRRFCRNLYGEIRRELKQDIHSETQAVTYILKGASEDDRYYSDCLVARKICKDRNWSRPTFTTYCKQKVGPTPKTIKRAAKKRTTIKKVRRDLKAL